MAKRKEQEERHVDDPPPPAPNESELAEPPAGGAEAPPPEPPAPAEPAASAPLQEPAPPPEPGSPHRHDLPFAKVLELGYRLHVAGTEPTEVIAKMAEATKVLEAERIRKEAIAAHGPVPEGFVRCTIHTGTLSLAGALRHPGDVVLIPSDEVAKLAHCLAPL